MEGANLPPLGNGLSSTSSVPLVMILIFCIYIFFLLIDLDAYVCRIWIRSSWMILCFEGFKLI